MTDPDLVPHDDRYDPGGSPEDAARSFFERMRRRRSVREYAPGSVSGTASGTISGAASRPLFQTSPQTAPRPVSRETVEWILRTAAWAPSGANRQPWRFVAISDPEVKRRIRLAAEEEERRFYRERASARWLEDLAPLGTGETKEFLETAPWLIAVFRLARGGDGGQVYYPAESVGIALGFLLAAAHHAGLGTLVYTPHPMGFLSGILGRPPNERPFALVPLGYPAEGCRVPASAMARRPFEEVAVFVEGGTSSQEPECPSQPRLQQEPQSPREPGTS